MRRTGEPYGLRDEGLLGSAVAAPANYFFYEGEDDVAVLAAVLVAAIARNHPFQQGNKRTAFAAAAAFLDINGFLLTADTEAFADLLVAVIERRSDVGDLAVAMNPYFKVIED